MNRIVSILFLFLFSLSLSAQDLMVKSFESSLTDLSASTNSRTDINGNLCALVKVQLPLDDAVFGESVVGEVVHNVNEYWVYMPAGTKHLVLKHPKYLTLKITFKDYGISSLESKSTYNLVVTPSSATDTCLHDYSQLRIGDYVYADGSFSHEAIDNMSPIGVLFSYQTSEKEKEMGWSHGQIVAMQDCGMKDMKVMWSATLEDVPAPHRNYLWKQGKGKNDLLACRDGYLYTYFGETDGYLFPAFAEARIYPVKKDQELFSEWYLPAIGQWIEILQNLGRVHLTDDKLQFNAELAYNNLQIINISNGWYWSSTECDASHAWMIRINYGKVTNATEKIKPFRVRAVAAF